MESIRLNKFLAERLGVSRREADDLISAGKITIDGKTAALGARITVPNDTNSSPKNLTHSTSTQNKATPVKIDKIPKICYNRKIVPFQADFLYVAFHKPVGYVCSRRAQGTTPTIYELLPKKYQHLKTVGRLDKDSSGLILLTNDGDFAYQMTHPKFHKEKIYEVELDRPLQPLHQQMISDYGIMLDDGPSKFLIVKNGTNMMAQNHYIVTLTEGRNRQIRRTFAALGYTVVKLHRTQFGKYQIGNLSLGKCDIIKP